VYLLKPSKGSFLLVLSAAKGSDDGEFSNGSDGEFSNGSGGEFSNGSAAISSHRENATPFPSFSLPEKQKSETFMQKEKVSKKSEYN
jgi:hypothetical protein